MVLNEIEELNVQRNDLENDDKYLELFIIRPESLHIASHYFSFLARLLVVSTNMSSKGLV
jgi:hypothetical protein